MNDTIFALSSGLPPAAIAIVRISGPSAAFAVTSLAGTLPSPKVASLRQLWDHDANQLDEAIVLWFPGPSTVTGEDLAEFHLHGGRAVIAAVQHTLNQLPGLRPADAGEFTRRAFANGRVDLAEAEGLADLLSAETELQRRLAMSMATGALSTKVESWRDQVLMISARIEAILDFGDEDDVGSVVPDFTPDIVKLLSNLHEVLNAPRAEALREGFRVVLAGPPNAGKSSLFNALVEDEAAITASIPGTTRDVLSRPIALEGVPFLFLDTAGLRMEAADEIEAIGIERASAELDRADLILWMGAEGEKVGDQLWEIESFADCQDPGKAKPRHRISAITGEGIAGLKRDLVATARSVMASPIGIALNERQHSLLSDAAMALDGALKSPDPLLQAEALRAGRVAFDKLLGRSTTEDMLDSLFGHFCIGK
ncbi:tRNA modification GTPase TrmE [Novosphingobium barchaimii]|nr:tRNA modification GTPase TrmE [Novosphingobium barchaimii]